MTINIKNFYLKTEIKDKQCMLMPVELTQEEIMIHCNLHETNHDVKMFTCIIKETHGLKEADALVNQQLQQHLAPYGYTPPEHIPGLWKYGTVNIFLL